MLRCPTRFAGCVMAVQTPVGELPQPDRSQTVPDLIRVLDPEAETCSKRDV